MKEECSRQGRNCLVPVACIACFGAAAWLVYLFFESGFCADAGGAFRFLAARCLTADGESYVPIYRTGTWLFWVMYGFSSILVGILIAGILGGAVAGLRSIWFDVLQGTVRRP